MQRAEIVWEILFGEPFEKYPDPNQPENTAHLSAMAKAERNRMKAFVEGPGKVLIDRWKKQIRANTIELLSTETKCDCELCWKTRKIKNIFELVLEAEEILSERKT